MDYIDKLELQTDEVEEVETLEKHKIINSEPFSVNKYNGHTREFLAINGDYDDGFKQIKETDGLGISCNVSKEVREARKDVNGIYHKKLKDRIDNEVNVLKTSLNNIKINLKNFGGIPNDKTADNKENINNAIKYLKDNYGGGTLEITDKYYFSPYINISSNIIIDGGGIGELILKDNVNEYWSCVYLKDVKNSAIKNITIDQNYQGNSHIDVNVVNKSNAVACIYINGSADINIKNVKMINTHGVWGIIADNKNKNLLIKNNYIDFHETNSSHIVGENYKYDNTRMLICSDGAIIENNKFFCDSTKGVTALEVHHRNGVARNNEIDGYRTGIILTPSFYTQETQDINNHIAEHNKIKNCEYGVVIWNFDITNTDGIKILNNKIEVNPAHFNSGNAFGVMFELNLKDKLKVIKNIEILDNFIMFEEDNRTFTDSDYAFNFNGITISAWYDMYNVNVTNNTIINSPACGIILGGKYNSGKWYTLNNCSITNNTLIDCCKNLNIAKTYVYPIVSVGSYKDCVIGENTIINKSNTNINKCVYEINQNNCSLNISPQNLISSTSNFIAPYTPIFKTLTLLNGHTGTVKITKNKDGLVTLFGNITLGTDSNGKTAFEIPVGYRPANQIIQTVSLVIWDKVTSYKGNGQTEYLNGISWYAEK